jgi:outer membrane protein
MLTVCLTSISARVSKTFALAIMASVLAVSPALASGAATTKAAQEGNKIAVIDVQYLVSNSKAGKSIRAQLDKKRDLYRKEIEKREADMNKEAKALSEQQGKLSKEEFGKKYAALNDKAKAGQKEVFERTKAFEKAYIDSLEKLREHIVKIVADISGKNNIALVLNRQEVVLVDAKMDLTKQVLTQLDAKVTTIPVNIK